METYGPDQRWIDVGLTGSVSAAVTFTATASAEYIILTPLTGSLSTAAPEARVEVSVDWSKVAGTTSSNATVTIAGGGTTLTINVPITPRSVPAGFKGFVEGDGVISIEAEHWTKNNAMNNVAWAGLPGYGKTLGAITPYPVLSAFPSSCSNPNSSRITAPRFAAGKGPYVYATPRRLKCLWLT
jgi:hypothetical protein